MYIMCSQADECGEPCGHKGNVDIKIGLFKKVIEAQGGCSFKCGRIHDELVTLTEAKAPDSQCQSIW